MAVEVEPYYDAEYTTVDGVIIRGWIYPAPKKGPAIIMTPGFNMPKEALLPDIASWFQKHGVTCFLHDPRGIGSSDGLKNDIDARRQAEDLHDAVTWFLQHPLVDEEKLGLWGLCFGGNVTLGAAAFDKRIASVISIAPMIDPSGKPERLQPILELAMHDRANRLEGEDPMYLPYVNEDGSIPNGLAMPADMMPMLERMGVPIANQVSLQTYYKLLSWNILDIVKHISPTPALMVSPEFDVSCPTEDQLKCYGNMGEPKELDILKGKGHLDWAFGDYENILERQLDFMKRSMKF